MAIDRGAKKGDEIDLEEYLNDLEHKMDRLKVLYEQYFMGIEKVEPQTSRKEVSRKLLELTQMNIRNTAIRYRFNALNQKYGVYTTYWNRTLRAIENGTYYRNVAKAGREAARKGLELPEELLKAMPLRMREKMIKDRAAVAERAAKLKPSIASDDFSLEDDLGEEAPTGVRPVKTTEVDESFDEKFDELFGNLSANDKPAAPVVKPAAVAPPAPVAPPPKPAVRPPPIPAAAAAAPVKRAGPPPIPGVAKGASPLVGGTPTSLPPRAPAPPAPPPPVAKKAVLPPGMDEQSAQELFKRYVAAKKVLGENTDSLRYEQIASTISKQGPKIMEQHNAKGVEFAVVIKDNKVILKATPKK